MNKRVEAAAQELVQKNNARLSNKLYTLVSGLKKKGYVKEAAELEQAVFNYKTSEIHLYNVFDRTGEDFLEEAYPDGGYDVDPESEYGKFYTPLEQARIMRELVSKRPTGNLNLVVKKKASYIKKASKEAEYEAWVEATRAAHKNTSSDPFPEEFYQNNVFNKKRQSMGLSPISFEKETEVTSQPSSESSDREVTSEQLTNMLAENARKLYSVITKEGVETVDDIIKVKNFLTLYYGLEKDEWTDTPVELAEPILDAAIAIEHIGIPNTSTGLKEMKSEVNQWFMTDTDMDDNKIKIWARSVKEWLSDKNLSAAQIEKLEEDMAKIDEQSRSLKSLTGNPTNSPEWWHNVSVMVNNLIKQIKDVGSIFDSKIDNPLKILKNMQTELAKQTTKTKIRSILPSSQTTPLNTDFVGIPLAVYTELTGLADTLIDNWEAVREQIQSNQDLAPALRGRKAQAAADNKALWTMFKEAFSPFNQGQKFLDFRSAVADHDRLRPYGDTHLSSPTAIRTLSALSTNLLEQMRKDYGGGNRKPLPKPGLQGSAKDPAQEPADESVSFFNEEMGFNTPANWEPGGIKKKAFLETGDPPTRGASPSSSQRRGPRRGPGVILPEVEALQQTLVSLANFLATEDGLKRATTSRELGGLGVEPNEINRVIAQLKLVGNADKKWGPNTNKGVTGLKDLYNLATGKTADIPSNIHFRSTTKPELLEQVSKALGYIKEISNELGVGNIAQRRQTATTSSIIDKINPAYQTANLVDWDVAVGEPRINVMRKDISSLSNFVNFLRNNKWIKGASSPVELALLKMGQAPMPSADYPAVPEMGGEASKPNRTPQVTVLPPGSQQASQQRTQTKIKEQEQARRNQTHTGFTFGDMTRALKLFVARGRQKGYGREMLALQNQWLTGLNNHFPKYALARPLFIEDIALVSTGPLPGQGSRQQIQQGQPVAAQPGAPQTGQLPGSPDIFGPILNLGMNVGGVDVPFAHPGFETLVKFTQLRNWTSGQDAPTILFNALAPTQIKQQLQRPKVPIERRRPNEIYTPMDWVRRLTQYMSLYLPELWKAWSEGKTHEEIIKESSKYRKWAMAVQYMPGYIDDIVQFYKGRTY